MSGGLIAPGFESHQCLVGMWRQLCCHAGCQEVVRCHTRGEYKGTCNVTHMPLLSSNKAEPTLALKPRGDVTGSPKQGYQWPHKKDSCPPKIFKKKFSQFNTVFGKIWQNRMLVPSPPPPESRRPCYEESRIRP